MISFFLFLFLNKKFSKFIFISINNKSENRIIRCEIFATQSGEKSISKKYILKTLSEKFRYKFWNANILNSLRMNHKIIQNEKFVLDLCNKIIDCFKWQKNTCDQNWLNQICCLITSNERKKIYKFFSIEKFLFKINCNSVLAWALIKSAFIRLKNESKWMNFYMNYSNKDHLIK